MLWKEILGGFVIAGFLPTLVPHNCWEVLFLQTGPPVIRLIENALVGPIIALLSFVCSVGNIPLASLLWSSGHQFRRRDFVYLRRFDRYPDHYHLRKVLRCPAGGLDYGDLVRIDGAGRNNCGSWVQCCPTHSGRRKTAERDRTRPYCL